MVSSRNDSKKYLWGWVFELSFDDKKIKNSSKISPICGLENFR